MSNAGRPIWDWPRPGPRPKMLARMRIPPPLHRWSLRPRAAIRLQERLAGLAQVRRLQRPLRLVAGADLAFTPDGRQCIAGIAVYSLQSQSIVEEAIAWRHVCFPYVPGLLTFREAPAVLAAVRKLRCEPDLFMFDGHGVAHPRRFGLASHTGVLIGRPSLGCAKSRLCGEECAPGLSAGSTAPLRFRGETIGTILRTQTGGKPVYVSIGHLITLEHAVAAVMRCITKYRLPEPTRQAHLLVTRYRRRLEGGKA